MDKLPFSYSRRLQDVQQLWDDLTTRPGLETMAKGLGLPGRAAPIAGDGDVWDRIAAGAYDDVLTYCDAEVLRLRCVYRAITGLPMLATDVALLKRDLSQVTDDELVAAGYSPLVRDGAAA